MPNDELVTSEMLAMWRAGDRELNNLLGLRPWEESPFDVCGAAPPAWMDSVRRARWKKAWQLRQLLDDAGNERR